jgi:hypothetical protein
VYFDLNFCEEEKFIKEEKVVNAAICQVVAIFDMQCGPECCNETSGEVDHILDIW